ncbi:type II toxin-antitoxin system HicA family toxin [Amycolatopsis jejuensis]|uniref:type II toxin-antitoxin system HicA family toxin n=1 Tax=Amycolatopsis jejuensis TaxID=330084 RepID=UPI000AFCF5CB|nr:type II toxin-antitoxin system HicA family toxin [Amycolatopsis jejuensis]
MVFKPMKRADVITALESNGCRKLRDSGDHTVYGCPCGKHRAPVPRHNSITPGVVRSIGKQMACLPQGWLQ